MVEVIICGFSTATNSRNYMKPAKMSRSTLGMFIPTCTQYAHMCTERRLALRLPEVCMEGHRTPQGDVLGWGVERADGTTEAKIRWTFVHAIPNERPPRLSYLHQTATTLAQKESDVQVPAPTSRDNLFRPNNCKGLMAPLAKPTGVKTPGTSQSTDHIAFLASVAL